MKRSFRWMNERESLNQAGDFLPWIRGWQALGPIGSLAVQAVDSTLLGVADRVTMPTLSSRAQDCETDLETLVVVLALPASAVVWASAVPVDRRH
jgi:hypothetical protein